MVGKKEDDFNGAGDSSGIFGTEVAPAEVLPEVAAPAVQVPDTSLIPATLTDAAEVVPAVLAEVSAAAPEVVPATQVPDTPSVSEVVAPATQVPDAPSVSEVVAPVSPILDALSVSEVVAPASPILDALAASEVVAPVSPILDALAASEVVAPASPILDALAASEVVAPVAPLEVPAALAIQVDQSTVALDDYENLTVAEQEIDRRYQRVYAEQEQYWQQYMRDQQAYAEQDGIDKYLQEIDAAKEIVKQYNALEVDGNKNTEGTPDGLSKLIKALVVDRNAEKTAKTIAKGEKDAASEARDAAFADLEALEKDLADAYKTLDIHVNEIGIELDKQIKAYQAVQVDGATPADAADLDTKIRALVIARDNLDRKKVMAEIGRKIEIGDANAIIKEYDKEYEKLHDMIDGYLADRTRAGYVLSTTITPNKTPANLDIKISELVRIAKFYTAEVIRLNDLIKTRYTPRETVAGEYDQITADMKKFVEAHSDINVSKGATSTGTVVVPNRKTPEDLRALHKGVTDYVVQLEGNNASLKKQTTTTATEQPLANKGKNAPLVCGLVGASTVAAVLGYLAFSNSNRSDDAELAAQTAIDEKNALKVDYDRRLAVAGKELADARAVKTSLESELADVNKTNTDIETEKSDLQKKIAAMIPPEKLKEAVDKYLTDNPDKVRKYTAEHPELVDHGAVVGYIVKQLQDKIITSTTHSDLVASLYSACDALGRPEQVAVLTQGSKPKLKHSTEGVFCDGLPTKIKYTSEQDFVVQVKAHGRSAVEKRYAGETAERRGFAFRVMESYAIRFANRQIDANKATGTWRNAGRFHIGCYGSKR